jgi:hypothetical protein
MWTFGMEVAVWKGHVDASSTHTRVAAFYIMSLYTSTATILMRPATQSAHRRHTCSRTNDISFVMCINFYNPLYKLFIISDPVIHQFRCHKKSTLQIFAQSPYCCFLFYKKTHFKERLIFLDDLFLNPTLRCGDVRESVVLYWTTLRSYDCRTLIVNERLVWSTGEVLMTEENWSIPGLIPQIHQFQAQVTLVSLCWCHKAG